MPPRKTAGRNPKSSSKKKTASSQAVQQQAHCCDGCAANIPEAEALNCCVCGVWLHRYCSGIPTSHYTSIAASFICAACRSLATDKSVILELRGEIEALKSEIVELRAAMEGMKPESNAKQQVANPTEEKQSGGQWTRVVKRPGRRNANAYGGHGRQAERAERQSANSQRRGDSRDTANSGPPTANLEKERVLSVGRIWGTRKDTSTSAVVKILKQYTSVGNKVAIQRKFRRLANDRLHWWYLIRSDESILEVLDSEWERVKSTTESARWKLPRSWNIARDPRDTIQLQSVKKVQSRRLDYSQLQKMMKKLTKHLPQMVTLKLIRLRYLF